MYLIITKWEENNFHVNSGYRHGSFVTWLVLSEIESSGRITHCNMANAIGMDHTYLKSKMD